MSDTFAVAVSNSIYELMEVQASLALRKPSLMDLPNSRLRNYKPQFYLLKIYPHSSKCRIQVVSGDLQDLGLTYNFVEQFATRHKFHDHVDLHTTGQDLQRRDPSEMMVKIESMCPIATKFC